MAQNPYEPPPGQGGPRGTGVPGSGTRASAGFGGGGNYSTDLLLRRRNVLDQLAALAGGPGPLIGTKDGNQPPVMPPISIVPGTGTWGLPGIKRNTLPQISDTQLPPQPPLPPGGEPTIFGQGPGSRPMWNPYAGIAGFDRYYVTTPEDVLRYGRKPNLRGLPSRERATQIGAASQALYGRSVRAPSSGVGYGYALSSQDDMLRRLLQERLYGRGGY